MMQQFHTQEYPTANRNYKDRLFRFVFKNKKDLLDLYNAINGTDYDNPEELEVNTLGNVLYLSMKNDLSFLIDAELNLYEHQSTYNPNMPMRGLLYFAGVYNRHISSREINIYSSSPKVFPFPPAHRVLQWNPGGTGPEDFKTVRSLPAANRGERALPGMSDSDVEYQLRA